jgi:pilus assembly protein CpaC
MAEPLRQRVALVMITAALLATLIVSGWAAQTPADMSLPVAGSRVMDFQNIKRVAVSDPMVADYVVLSAKQIMLTGKAPGATDFYIWDDKGQHKFRVAVTAAPSGMGDIVSRIEEAIGRPEVRVSAHNDIILLEGEVDTAAEAERAGAIAAAYAPRISNLVRPRSLAGGPVLDVAAIQAAVGPSIQVSTLSDRILLFAGTATPAQKARLDQIIRGLGTQIGVVDTVSAPAYEPRQILVHVKVVDCNRSALSEIGVTWGGLTAGGQVHDQPFLFGEVFTEPQGLLEGGPILRLEGLSALLKLLVTTNKARILAEPNLLVTEGKRADILVGGEIPIPVVQSVGGGLGAVGAVTVEWKEFGVALAIEGTVSADGQSIDLDVSPEVSNLDYGNAVVVAGIRLPALRTRRAHTVLHMGNCQTLVIGGLYQSDQVKTVTGIPFLKDLPILGPLFRRTDKEQRDSELVIFVTPEVLTKTSAAARTEDALKQTGETR